MTAESTPQPRGSKRPARTVSDRELLGQLLRTDLVAFIVRAFQTINPSTAYKHNWHIEAIAYQLQRCAEGESQNLLITQPPRSLKSICTSVAFVAWMLGRDPSLKFICISYNNDLTVELARQFRAVVDSEWYRRVFPNMRAQKDTGLEFVTSAGGSRYATSVGGTLTGRGADIIIIDDPMKADDALSKTAREKVLSWYRNVLVTRLNDKSTGVKIVVMQRLHEEDLAGYLKAQGGWSHLDLPAIAIEPESIQTGKDDFHVRSPGELLHPEHETQKALDGLKASLGSFMFTAQYQQRPVPLDGNLIRKPWFKLFDHEPAHDRDGYRVQSWDVASKVGEKNDYSVCTTWLVKKEDFYLIDVVRERLEFPDLKRRVRELKRYWGARYVLIEDKNSGTPLIQDLRDEPPYLHAIAIEPERDKLTRMEAEAASIEAGQVHLKKDAPWLEDFLSEVLAFPYGKHDDQIDSMSQFLRWRRSHKRNRMRTGRIHGCIVVYDPD